MAEKKKNKKDGAKTPSKASKASNEASNAANDASTNEVKAGDKPPTCRSSAPSGW